MKTGALHPWVSAGFDSLQLGWEAAGVISLRTARMAGGGPAAASEALLMVAEKWAAAAELQVELLTSGSRDPMLATQRTLRHYRRKVAANHRRLR